MKRILKTDAEKVN